MCSLTKKTKVTEDDIEKVEERLRATKSASAVQQEFKLYSYRAIWRVARDAKIPLTGASQRMKRLIDEKDDVIKRANQGAKDKLTLLRKVPAFNELLQKGQKAAAKRRALKRATKANGIAAD